MGVINLIGEKLNCFFFFNVHFSHSESVQLCRRGGCVALTKVFAGTTTCDKLMI